VLSHAIEQLYGNVVKAKEGDTLLVDDGRVSLRIDQKTETLHVEWD